MLPGLSRSNIHYLNLNFYCLLLCCCYAVPTSFAQTATYVQEKLPTEIDNQEEWQQIIERSELETFTDYLDELEAEENKIKPTTKKDKVNYQLSQPHPAVVVLMKILLIAAGIGIIAFLLYKLLGEVNAPRNRKIKRGRLSEISLEEIEENMVEADLSNFIEQAIAEKNFNLAIRLYYLLIIKELSSRKLIQYQKDKTNRSYLHELAGTDFYTDFQQTTQLFERIWYGQDELSSTDFQQIQPTFQAYVHALQRQSVTV